MTINAHTISLDLQKAAALFIARWSIAVKERGKTDEKIH